jgi:D-sedoheptulose 7-phosphate isomerase
MKEHLHELMERHPQLAGCRADIEAAADLLADCYRQDGTVYICGNGGSAADAEHIVGELMKSFTARRAVSAEVIERIGDPTLTDHLEGALRAVSMCGHVSLSTAFANDVAPELVFAQQVYGWGRLGDVCWGLSTSGNSNNVIAALKVARAKDMKTLGMTGQGGGEVAVLCDVCIRVPETETYKVQELHLPVYHTLCRMLETTYFGDEE